MTTPIVESIIANVATNIDLVTVANGFNQTLNAVRSRRQDFSDVAAANYDVLIVMTGLDSIEGAAMMETWSLELILVCFVIESDATSTSIETTCNKVASDIYKKLMADVERSSLAIDTVITEQTIFNDGAGWSGIALAVSIEFRHAVGDPYPPA